MGACKECCVGFSKLILIVFNVIIVICALVMIVEGSILMSNTAGLDIKRAYGFAIGLGVIMVFIAFAGCWGAISENSCWLTIYAGILLTLFVGQIILAIVAFAGTGDESDIREAVRLTLTKMYNDLDDPSNLKTINFFQSEAKCCGLNGPDGSEVNSMGLMQSCCPDTVNRCTQSVAYQMSCTDSLTYYMINGLFITGITAILFAIVELVCAIFAFCVRGSIRKQGRLLV